MATSTPNIGLTKPVGTEKYDLDIVNGNSDIIDAEITDAKAGSNLRIFKVKNDLTDQDNAVSRVSGDARYLGISAVASSALKLATARSIALGGDCSGSANFDGSANVTITATVANDSHTHDGRYFTESESDARYLGINAKASDSDKLDGLDSTAFVRTIAKQALHATDALRVVGNDLYLYKGDGTQENIVIPSFDAGKLFSTNGYQKFNNGLIIQWGLSNSIAQSAVLNVTFPIAFPTACLGASSIRKGTDNKYDGISVNSISSTVIALRNANVATQVYWFAIGY